MDVQLLWLVCWGILFAISLVDLKDNRIPNRLVFLLFFAVLGSNALLKDGAWILDSLLGGATVFAVSLFFYIVKAMAAGDVKLLAVIGFWQGWHNLSSLAFYLIIASALVGIFYYVYNSIHFGSSFSAKKLAYLANKHTRQYVDIHVTQMPMAPAIMIGMALYSYFTI